MKKLTNRIYRILDKCNVEHVFSDPPPLWYTFSDNHYTLKSFKSNSKFVNIYDYTVPVNAAIDSTTFSHNNPQTIKASSQLSIDMSEKVRGNVMVKGKSATYSQLFREADALDCLLMILGTLSSLGNGASLPAFIVLFGRILDELNGEMTNIQSTVNYVATLFLIVGAGNLVASFSQVVSWTVTGERQVQKIRNKYIRAILSQEIGWFDTCGAAELSTRCADTCGKLQDGLGRHLGALLQNLFTFLTSFVVAFYLSWNLTVVLLASLPFIAGAGAFMVCSYD